MMPPVSAKKDRKIFSYKSQKRPDQISVPLKYFKEDGEIKCKTPQIEEQPAEPIDNLFREQKMREFSL